MIDEIVNQLKDILVNKLDVNLKHEEIKEDMSLYEGGIGLDSIAIVRLVVAIEKQFSIEIEDDELNADLFKNMHYLAEFINKKKA
ncbi:MAG: acyl carrier protein [bacterium]|nr:acyl carrier protein [bacterium]